MSDRVAVLGTGIMGAPIARNLLEAGFDVSVWNRSPDKALSLVEHGADAADSPPDAVHGAGFVITMVTDIRAVHEVMRPAGAAMRDDAIWLQMSTVGEETDSLVRVAEEHGVTFVDAPVVGTKQPAEQGALIVLASG